MAAQAKLTDTQTAILKAAAAHADGNILLTDAGYATVGKRRPVPKGVQKMDTQDGVAKRDAHDALTKREVTHALQKLEPTPPTIRPGTKLAAIIDAMRRPDGVTIAQMTASTGWQARTVRGAISGMVRKRLGFEVITEKGADGQRAYRIA